jgi:acid phosphatase
VAGLTAATASASVHSFASGSVRGTQVTSGPLGILAGDVVVVFVAIRGSADVQSVSDSAGDTFTRLAYQERTDNTSREGLSIWDAPNAAAGSDVTVTATSAVLLRLVLLAIDVTGVPTSSPVDSLSSFSVGSSSPAQYHGQATSKDLVLLAAAVEGGSQVGPVGADSLVEQLTYSTAPKDTGAVLEQAAGTTGNLTMNASFAPAVPWISAVLSLRGGGGGGGGSPHSIWNVVVIYLENLDIQDLNRAPGTGYLKYLSATYVNSTSYFGVCHPSAPNYLALIDGDPLQCGSDTVHKGQYHNTTLPDLLDAHQLTWGGYFESMPTACDASSTGSYVARHNPFVYFSDIWSNTSRCKSHVVNSAVFNASITSNHTLPANVSFYAPNEIDDGHSSSAATASTWLKGFLGNILNTSNSQLRQVVNHTVFMITFDESDGTGGGAGAQGDGTSGNQTTYDSAGYNGTYGGNVWFTAVNTGGYVARGHYTADTTHYRILTTIEWLFNLGNTGGVDAGTRFPAMTKLFTFSTNGY